MGNEENKISDASDSRFRASGHDALQENMALAFEKARRAIAAYSPRLNPDLFNQSRVVAAMTKLFAGGRPNNIRILVDHGQESIQNNGRLTDLAQRFSDFVELRQLGDGIKAPSDTFVVIDSKIYLHQMESDKAECIVDLEPSHEGSALAKRFEQMWERSEAIVGLRVVGLGR